MAALWMVFIKALAVSAPPLKTADVGEMATQNQRLDRLWFARSFIRYFYG